MAASSLMTRSFSPGMEVVGAPEHVSGRVVQRGPCHPAGADHGHQTFRVGETDEVRLDVVAVVETHGDVEAFSDGWDGHFDPVAGSACDLTASGSAPALIAKTITAVIARPMPEHAANPVSADRLRPS
jgi:hypothetical protein